MRAHLFRLVMVQGCSAESAAAAPTLMLHDCFGAEGEGVCHAPVWENVACDSTLSLAAHDDYGGSADM